MSFLDDTRYSLRALAKAPAFSLTAILTLALGIGANTAVFSVADAVLLRPLPYTEPDSLMAITYRTRFGTQVPSPPLAGWSGQSRTCLGFAPYNTGELILLTTAGEQVRVSAAWISHRLFSILDVAPVSFGRGLQSSDDRVGAPPVVMLSHAFWRSRFHGNEQIIGRAIQLRGRSYTVIGVTTEAFRFPGHATPDVLLPIALPADSTVVRLFSGVVTRLRRESSPDQAQAELLTIVRRTEGTYPAAMRSILDPDSAPMVTLLQQHIARDLRPVLFATLGAVGLILLVACANVASLLLARTMSREREVTIRAAMGATPGRLARLLFVEVALLAAFGGGAALLTQFWLLQGLRALLASSAPHADTITIGPSVLAFAGLTTVLAALLCAAIPIARVLGRNPAAGSKLASAGVMRAARRDSLRAVLVSGQVSLALILLIGELLLVHTLWRLTSVELGFDPAHVLTLRVSASGLGRNPGASLEDILERIRALPDVASAGSSTVFPLSGHNFSFAIAIAGQPAPLADAPPTSVDVVSPGYFRTMGVRLVDGRDFDRRDTSTGLPIAIVNTAFGRLRFGDANPIGRHLTLGGAPEDANIAIVGIVNDIRDANPGDAVEPTVYRPFTQAAPQIGWHTAAIAIRTSSDPSSLIEPVRKAIQSIAPATAAYDFAPMEYRLAEAVAPERQRVLLFGFFAAITLALTAVGLYGFLAYAVMQDLHDLGVRRALGATRTQLLCQVMMRTVWPTLAGVVLGIAGALALTRTLAGFLHGVSPTDPGTFVAAALTMMLISVVASVVPARRAIGADPMTVLRVE